MKTLLDYLYIQFIHQKYLFTLIIYARGQYINKNRNLKSNLCWYQRNSQHVAINAWHKRQAYEKFPIFIFFVCIGNNKPTQHFIQHFWIMLTEMLDTFFIYTSMQHIPSKSQGILPPFIESSYIRILVYEFCCIFKMEVEQALILADN